MKVILLLIVTLSTISGHASWKSLFESKPKPIYDIAGHTARGFVELNIIEEDNLISVKGHTATLGWVDVSINQNKQKSQTLVDGSTGAGGWVDIKSSQNDEHSFSTTGAVAALGWVDLKITKLNNQLYKISGHTASIGWVDVAVKVSNNTLDISGSTGRGFVTIKANSSKLDIQLIPTIIILTIK